MFCLDLQALNQYDSAARDLFQLQKIEPKNAAAKKELEVVLDLCRKVNVNNNRRIGLYQDSIKLICANGKRDSGAKLTSPKFCLSFTQTVNRPMVNNHSLAFLDDQVVPQLCPQATWTAAGPRKMVLLHYGPNNQPFMK